MRGANTMPASGRSMSIELNTASRPLAMPKPAARPISEASRPMTSASTSTEPSTCRRAAPTIRSSPNSRERWATVIESVLKIVNAPTRTATKPNTISTDRDDPDEHLQPVEGEAVLLLGGLHLRGGAELGGDRLADVRRPGVPSLPTARIES